MMIILQRNVLDRVHGPCLLDDGEAVTVVDIVGDAVIVTISKEVAAEDETHNPLAGNADV